MIEKIRTAAWFLQRPNFWKHAFQLARRKLQTNYDTPPLREKARKWATEQVVPYRVAFEKLGIEGDTCGLSDAVIQEGEQLAAKSAVKMGGPGDLNLLFDAVRLTEAQCVIETGVAYGWSSLAILNALSNNSDGRLYSVDMPYPKMGNEAFVGIVVPNRFRSRWTLIREPDRNGLRKAINKSGGQIDLCHYDSDKSWWGRAYAFPLLWDALRSGGLFISDDIQDNLYFAEFVKSKSLPFAVTKSEGKFVGLIRKP